MEPQLLHSVGDGVATVVIHHPAKRNAMTADMWRALPPLLDGLAADPDVRVLEAFPAVFAADVPADVTKVLAVAQRPLAAGAF
ncbi:enoyl-CoA hydratase/isomerase family protein, partial [Streptomyces mirabilis]